MTISENITSIRKKQGNKVINLICFKTKISRRGITKGSSRLSHKFKLNGYESHNRSSFTISTNMFYKVDNYVVKNNFKYCRHDGIIN